jgi:hypothetical protein
MNGTGQPDLQRIRQLAIELAATDDGPAGELACALADAVVDLSDRVDALWRLISAVVESAGLAAPTAGRPGAAIGPPSEFVQALNSARATGRRGVRLCIDGKEWVAALSQQPPFPDGAAWSAIERLTRESTDQDDM